MKVLLVHAYSRANSGDGLLVDLSAELAREAAGQDVELRVVASDASSFRPDEDVLQWAGPLRTPSTTLDLVAAGVLGPSRRIRFAVRDADLVLAVGGGYLRGRTQAAALKSLLVHVRQLHHVVVHAGVPVVYLPQSIGPLPWWSRRLTQRALARASVVCVRDDVSAAELRPRVAPRRFPDLAVLELARRPPAIRLDGRVPDPVVFVPRRLPSPKRYDELVRHVVREHADWEWAAQSTGRGNDDRAFIAEVAGREARTLKQVLESPGEVGIVVSTRLHGSVEALLAGVPTIHLSYERKGMAAFEDLGLSRFVSSARRTSPEWLEARVEEIRSDPARYWDQVEQARGRLSERREELVALLREALVGSRGGAGTSAAPATARTAAR